MKELRCIVFTERELISAVIGRRRKRNEELPQGTVESVKFRTGDTIETVMEVKDDYGKVTNLVLSEPEVAAALIAFCMGRNPPAGRGGKGAPRDQGRRHPDHHHEFQQGATSGQYQP